MPWLGVLWHLVGMADSGAPGLLAGTTVALGAILLTVLAAALLTGRRLPRYGIARFARAPRRYARRLLVPHLCDPDAPGRARPRAPSVAAPAAWCPASR